MKIDNLNPAIGPVGTLVTISGSGFGPTQGADTVAFNGTPVTPTSWKDTEIVVHVPPGITSGPVVVQINGVETGAGTFTIATDGRPFILDPAAAIAALDVRVTALEARFPQRDPVTGLDVARRAQAAPLRDPVTGLDVVPIAPVIKA
jgi:hypothetical protein